MKVYLLLKIEEMTEFIDCYGKTAPDKEEIVNVFNTEEKAKNEKLKLEKQMKDEEDTDCIFYVIREYAVQ